MAAAAMCPTEDAIAALLEYLVDPTLPRKCSARDIPSQLNQESVAKQVHAVVLLYNYYIRKHHPQLEFIGFESFCKLAVILRPTLLAYMKLMQRSNDTELDDLEKQLSSTEKKIMDACDISATLDASKNDPTMEGWPISKVAVFLVDSRKENCFLYFGSIVKGVWSVIEKDVDVSNSGAEGTLDSQHVNKKKRIIRKPLRNKSGIDEAGFQQLAFSAVKEATGINHSDLVVFESHVVYSLSKEKAAARFYIMQYSQPNGNDVIQIPIKDAIDSLQGPLITKSSHGWTPTSVVEYFLLLPYSGILTDWLSKKGPSNSLQIQTVRLRTGNEYSFKTTEPCEPEVPKRPVGSHANDNDVEFLGSNTSSGSLKQNRNNEDLGSKKVSLSPKQNDNNGCCMVDLCDDSDGAYNMEAHNFSVAHTQEEDKNRNIGWKQPEDYQKMTACKERGSNGTRSGDQVKENTECRGGNAANGNKNCNIISSDQDGMHINDVTHLSNSKNLDKLSTIIASKNKELSQAALRFILRKRDKLSFQQRDIEDQIAECDRSIQTILNGGEDDLALKIESIIEGCNEVCPRHVAQERGYQHSDDQRSLQLTKKKLPGTILDMQNPCQGLDNICYENNWVLPTYRVSALDGEFKASVTVKGMDFECSSEGELHPSSHEARKSAAAQVLSKLRDVPNMAQYFWDLRSRSKEWHLGLTT